MTPELITQLLKDGGIFSILAGVGLLVVYRMVNKSLKGNGNITMEDCKKENEKYQEQFEKKFEILGDKIDLLDEKINHIDKKLDYLTSRK